MRLVPTTVFAVALLAAIAGCKSQHSSEVQARDRLDFNQGDAIFDNFLATTVEPRIAILQNNGLTLSFPNTGFRLQSTAALGTTWTDVAGVTISGASNTFNLPTGVTAFYRLVFP